jgi:hypothetical protein
LQACTAPLGFPAVERLTTLLEDEARGAGSMPHLGRPPPNLDFVDVPVTSAQGPFQSAHEDVAQGMGSLSVLAVDQRPEPAFARCRRDAAFRWLLGTLGLSLEVTGLSGLGHPG